MYVPGLPPERVEDAHNALLRALDHAPGERRFAESVRFTEVLPLPEGASGRDSIPLTELESYIETRRTRREESGAQ